MHETPSPTRAVRRRHSPTLGVALLVVLTASLLALLGLGLTSAPAAHADDAPVLEYYGTDTCPFCREMQPFLDRLEDDYPGLVVARYDVSNTANAERWEQEMAARGEQAQGVPTAILGDEVWVGFNDQIAAEITRTVSDTPGVDTPREDDAAAAPADEDGSGGPSPFAIAIGAAVVLAVAVALFAPRRARGDQG